MGSISIPQGISKQSRIALQKSMRRFASDKTPQWESVTLTDLTATRLVQTDSNKTLASVSNLTNWIAGTSNEIDVTDDNDGTVTIGIVNPLIVGKGGTGLATLTDHSILLGSGTDAITPLGAATNGQIPIGYTGTDPVLAGITGTTNQITVTNGAGTITLSAPQDIHTAASPQFAKLNIDGTNIYIDSDGSGNMTLTDTVVGTRTLKQLGSPTYKYIKATTQSEGNLHLSDATYWAISKALIKYIRIITSSTNWDLYILQNDNGYAADDANIPKLKIADEIIGNANLWLDLPYQDEDATNEVHLYYLDNSGANTADIYILGMEMV